MVLTGINRNTPRVHTPQIPHVPASDRGWAAMQFSFKAICVWTVVCRQAERVPVRRRHYSYAGVIIPSRALLQQQIFQYSVQHNYMSFMWEQLRVSVLTDHHQAISTVFKNKVKNVIRVDSPFVIITAWAPTSGQCCSFRNWCRGADNSLARPTSRCILFNDDNILFDASLVSLCVCVCVCVCV